MSDCIQVWLQNAAEYETMAAFLPLNKGAEGFYQ
jgi:hypothetical protein